MPRSCGTACACRPRATAPGTTLLIASGNGHVLALLGALARDRGLAVERREATLWLTGDALPGFVLEADDHLTATERAEARAVFTDDAGVTDALVGAALLAPSLGTLAARTRETGLEAALEREQGFFSRYQPIVELATGAVIAHEALLRAEIDGEEVLPERLFGIAGSTDRLHALDRIARDRAIQGAQPWLGDQLLFVNMNPTSVYRPALCLETTARAVDESGLALGQLVFEVVESHRVADRGHLVAVLDHYRSMGCRIALDDVGAGYSSLLLAVAVRPEVVKIDGELIRALPHDHAAVAVVNAVIGLSHDFGATVVAEGVETEEQAAAARDLGADWAQGWLFGRPERPGASTARPSAGRPRSMPPHPASAVVDGGVPGLLTQAMRTATAAISLTDATRAGHPVVYVNAAFEQLTGYRREAVLGRPGTDFVVTDSDADTAALDEVLRGLADGRQVRARLRSRRPDGSTWWNEMRVSPVQDGHGRTTHYFAVQEDASRAVASEERDRHRASHDPLTGLANRALGAEHLERELRRTERTGRGVALLYCDLDGFKDVNDRFGHALGDEVLVHAVQRIEHAIRAGDLLVRQGGDEFLLVLADLGEDAEEVAGEVARHVTTAFARPFAVDDQEVALGVSIGWSLCPRDGTTASRLLARADAAMYDVKRANRR